MRERDIAADDALQLGEFAHRFRHQVGLGEMGRSRCFACVRAHELRKLPRQEFDAQGPLKLRPELLMEGNLAQKPVRPSNGRSRSLSQKNFASESRARITRSLPAAMALPPSAASKLETG